MPAMSFATFDQWPVLAELGISLGLGLLIGIQRGWTLRHEADGSRFAGVRTFGLLGLVGGLAGLTEPVDGAAAVLLFGTAAFLILIGYARTARRNGRVSGTSSLAALIALATGFLATRGETQLAVVVAVAATLLLTLRPQLHRWVEGMSEAEVSAIARFALIALVVLPLLPDRHLGPYEAWNPRQLWLVVVLVSGFSFAGYFASKNFGATRGTLAMAATGAMVSSTAVTVALATRLRDEQENAPALVAGIAAGSAVMLVRVIILVALLAPMALGALSLIIAPAALTSLVAVVFELVAAKAAGPHHAGSHLAFAFVTVVGSWLLLPTLFALTYAAAYYGPEPDGGLDFPKSPPTFEPEHTDFLYFSFTIAVTAQTSDVAVTTREMRRLVLAHSILSFLFNTTILAFAINAAAGFF